MAAGQVCVCGVFETCTGRLDGKNYSHVWKNVHCFSNVIVCLMWIAQSGIIKNMSPAYSCLVGVGLQC